jgi:hypothetical protein
MARIANDMNVGIRFVIQAIGRLSGILTRRRAARVRRELKSGNA